MRTPVGARTEAGDVDDSSPTLCGHQGSDRLSAPEVPEHLTFMSSQNSSPVTSASFGGRGLAQGLGGTIDEDIDAAQCGVGVLDQRKHGLLVTGLDDDRGDAPVGAVGQLAGRRFERRPCPGGDDNIAAFGGERSGHRFADAAASTVTIARLPSSPRSIGAV